MADAMDHRNTAAGGRPGMFRLVRYFAVTSAVALIAVALVLYLLYRQTAVEEIVEAAQNSNAVLAQSLANALWPGYTRYTDAVAYAGSEFSADRPEIPEFDRAVAPLVTGLPVLKIVIYDPQGLIAYSSEKGEIGAVGADHPDNFEAALMGRSLSHITFRDSILSFEGEIADRMVVETYLPFRGPNGGLEGVFELYTDVTDRVLETNRFSAMLLGVLLVVFSLLYAVLLLVVRGANGILARQYGDLEKSQDEIQGKNVELLAEIEHRNKVEEELRHARQEAEHANRAKSRFLANMSHELRTPLNAIIGFSEVMAEQVLGRVTPSRYREYASDIRDSGHRLLALVNDVLDLSKIEAGKVDIVLAPFEICDAVRTALRTVEPAAIRNGNTLKIDCCGTLGAMTSDRDKLVGVLINLVGNAAKFTQNGLILLKVAREEDADGRWVVFSISDTGIGMAAGKVDEMFEDFTQSENPMTRAHDGTGLGLSISRRFCELLGGAIGIESEPGTGSTVTVRLPDQATRQTESPAETDTAGEAPIS